MNKKLLAGLKKGKYAIAVLALGLVLILLPKTGQTKSDDTSQTESQAQRFDLEAQEKKIESALSDIDGAGQVKVVLALSTDTRRVLAQDESAKTDTADNQSRTETTVKTVTVSGRSTGESPVVLYNIYPQYQGALAVVQGADSAGVKLAVTKAISSLTGLGSDKITVVKMKDG